MNIPVDLIDTEIIPDPFTPQPGDVYSRSHAGPEGIVAGDGAPCRVVVVSVDPAFALDTADRNEPEVARSWAAFNVERTREFVTRLTRT